MPFNNLLFLKSFNLWAFQGYTHTTKGLWWCAVLNCVNCAFLHTFHTFFFQTPCVNCAFLHTFAIDYFGKTMYNFLKELKKEGEKGESKNI